MSAPNIFPQAIKTDAAFQELTASGVFADFSPESPFLSTTTPMVAVGSCFASNVTQHLRALQYDVQTLSISDRLYSPLALQYFFENIDKNTAIFQKHWHIDESAVADVAKRLSIGATIVITFGMSVHWIDTETKEPVFDPSIKVKRAIVLPGERYIMQQTTLNENVEAMTAMLAAIKRLNPANRVILTLSPLPMVFSNNRPVVVADCISKSTLRVAIAEIMRLVPEGVYYFPSYELLKWLAPMVDRIWGGDGLLSHIRPEWIKYTLDQFSGLYCEGYESKLAPPVGEYPTIPAE